MSARPSEAAAAPKQSAAPVQQKPAEATKPKKPLNFVVRAILVSYNFFATCLWFFIMALTVMKVYHAVAVEQRPALFGKDVFDQQVGVLMQHAQVIAFVETGFVILGWTAGGIGATFLQCFTRCLVIFGTMAQPDPCPTRDSHWVGAVCVVAWALSEMIRYSYYIAGLLLGDGAAVPFPIKWVRYTAFLLLYPLGFMCEMRYLCWTEPVARAKAGWTFHLPLQWRLRAGIAQQPTAPYWFFVLVMALFPPGFAYLFYYMIRARKKQLSPPAADVAGGGAAEKTTKTD